MSWGWRIVEQVIADRTDKRWNLKLRLNSRLSSKTMARVLSGTNFVKKQLRLVLVVVGGVVRVEGRKRHWDGARRRTANSLVVNIGVRSGRARPVQMMKARSASATEW